MQTLNLEEPNSTNLESEKNKEPSKLAPEISNLALTSSTENVISSESKTEKQGNEWVPIDREARKFENFSKINQNLNLTESKEKSYTGLWLNEDGGGWTPQTEDANAGPETKIDDWVPVVQKTRTEKMLKLSTNQNSKTDKTLGKLVEKC